MDRRRRRSPLRRHQPLHRRGHGARASRRQGRRETGGRCRAPLVRGRRLAPQVAAAAHADHVSDVEHLQEVSDDWGLLESQNAGAALRKTSVVDVPLAIEWFRSMAEQALSVPWYEPLPWIDSPYVSWNFVQREPVGVCAGIIPWNYPLIFAMWKIAPALAMGNSMILKPAPQTPLTALALARAIDETGLLPPGVLNVVTGDSVDAGIELVENPDVDKVGSPVQPRPGRRVLAAAAPTIKKVTLELGGKSANIVCPDADLDIAVDGALFGTFFHQGQMCESGTRLFVHDDIYDTFVDRLVDGAASLRVGDAADFDTQVGPVINRAQYDMILSAVERAKQEGATVACGGGRAPNVGDRGFFIQPTVLTDVRPELSHAGTEEIFGPVLAVQRWSDLGEVIQRANRTIYGLAGGVWSRDTRGGHRDCETASHRDRLDQRLAPAQSTGAVRRLQAERHRSRARARGAPRVHRGEAHPRRPGRAPQRALLLGRAARLSRELSRRTRRSPPRPPWTLHRQVVHAVDPDEPRTVANDLLRPGDRAHLR